MSYIIVRGAERQGGFVSMVEKKRVKGSVRTVAYVCGLGSMSITEFKTFQKWAHSFKDQEERKQMVLSSGRAITEKEEVPKRIAETKASLKARRKAPVKQAQKQRVKNFTICPMCGSKNIKYVDTTSDKTGHGRVDTSLCKECGALAGHDTDELEKVPYHKTPKKTVRKHYPVRPMAGYKGTERCMTHTQIMMGKETERRKIRGQAEVKEKYKAMPAKERAARIKELGVKRRHWKQEYRHWDVIISEGGLYSAKKERAHRVKAEQKISAIDEETKRLKDWR